MKKALYGKCKKFSMRNFDATTRQACANFHNKVTQNNV